MQIRQVTWGIFILQYKIFDHVFMSNMKELFRLDFPLHIKAPQREVYV